MEFLSSIRWRPTIGDPSALGWFTVFAYGFTAALVAWIVKRSSLDRMRQGGPKIRTVWISIFILMVFLCVNKQLDLQALLTDTGRALSTSQGWYGERRTFQKWFVLGVLAGSGLFAVWVICTFRIFWRDHALLLSGLFLLLTFIVVRAISFHHGDELLRTHLGGIRMHWLLELAGIFLIALAAAREIWQTKEADFKEG